MTVAVGKIVTVEYTLRLEDQSVVETNVGAEPLTYTHGSEQIIRGLEKGLEGMAVGERKEVTVAPAEGYGTIHPEGLFEVTKDRIPTDGLRVGAQLQGTGPDGRPVYPRVTEIKDNSVVLDLNHPLAGKTLYFDVRVLDIKAEQPPGQ
ncbi:MAG TPA: peptidylprolyl isomerase [Nitrospiraceae bacterium]|jgi:FKBP-type peptidyl-prolyl cis-trans isomerase SlyD|nr:peptidylprolyl isomerase [Nitrospiraceae bacterium]